MVFEDQERVVELEAAVWEALALLRSILPPLKSGYVKQAEAALAVVMDERCNPTKAAELDCKR